MGLWSIPFHWYGFIAGVAVTVGLLLVERRLKQVRTSAKDVPVTIDNNHYWQLTWWVIIWGVIGSRIWHVVTDYYLYFPDNILHIFQIWQGGLSILGAVVGGLVGLFLGLWWWGDQRAGWWWLDLCCYGLPMGQAVGRIANAVNQELYGLPTTLPWAITIDEAHRLPGYAHVATYHPLFAYEATGTALFGFWLWMEQPRPRYFPHLQVGNGTVFLGYVVYYSILRFALDFLRLDKAISPLFWGVQLGTNQVILLLILGISSYGFWRRFTVTTQ